ncbi:hypothetical protein SODALDRAFT_16329 [Sodiomyces alkalinus F11]|uniref:Survival Motor Neuron Gemin2-binding domain-containing protein n=1 Tax=Sodiomyces alkalinus (strain CBS 110278 / VKM F-3762 / F11) TaxID=1314773 RepID=A0A3N2Q6U5_SODAK|nr:hypothetical protein SODALDRAFT_16329 [Sodiomyces alkalinus F11]ROT42470.1 hypothetical protein SODALDRAFT_16329 [Sodiomyces alkalinus F11]
MGTGGKNLAHDEIWDDSALIESWNEALNEYKKYHSIHAKGGRLEDLELEAEELAGDQTQMEGVVETQSDDHRPRSKQQPQDSTAEALLETTAAAQVQPGHGAPIVPPQAILGTVHDEGLKRLLMSWYYAGYYTGLYEGQQQQQQTTTTTTTTTTAPPRQEGQEPGRD